jgi:UDP-glucose 4-epimerase
VASLLLTGATGLVGSRLLPRLAEAGFDCRALVRRDVDLPAGTTTVRGELDDPGSLRAAVEGVDAIVHFAALFRTDDEAAIWRANLDGTRNLIDAAKAHAPGARFVMASTGNVYDADSRRPARVTDDCAPTAAYPASKLAAEALCATAASPGLCSASRSSTATLTATSSRCRRWRRASDSIPRTSIRWPTTATSRPL